MAEKIKGMFGSFERAEEVKDWLKSHGAEELCDCYSDRNIYYVGEDRCIHWAYKNYEELFDIVELPKPEHEFKPFDRVLVRDNIIDIWTPYLYGLYSEDSMYPHFVLGGSRWKYCIPYEGNEHIIGTTKNPEE